MKALKTKSIAALSALLMITGALATPAFAERYYNGYSRYNDRYERGGMNWSQKQYVKKGLIGAGAGAAIGALMGEEGYRAGSAIKGGLIGAGAGLGYEYLRRKW